MPTDESFKFLKEKLLELDPVYWCEKYLMVDGKPLKLTESGYKPFCDIYRYLGIKALEPNALPVILVKGRQIGGSLMAGAMSLYFMGCGIFGVNGKPPIRIIHAFPQKEQAEKYSKEKLNPMIASSRPIDDEKLAKRGMSKSYLQNLLDRNSDTGDSLHFKLFQNGNFLRIDSTGLDGGRLRGGSSDVFLFDETQDIPGSAIENCSEMLKQSRHGAIGKGISLFFGTPKKKGSYFYKRWMSSSQQYYYLGCEQCKDYFALFTPGSNDWEKIWIHGFTVKCPHCGFEQNKNEAAERGKWVATRPLTDPDVSMIGFHINQFFMPHISREAIESERPGIHPTNSERKFQNEVLGEFFQGDSSPISSEDIIEACGDRERGIRKIIKPGEEQMVILGIDYGRRNDLEQLANPEKGRQGQSYTTAVVMSLKGPNLFNIELALKFPRNDPSYKKGLIDTIMRQYSVDLCVGDIGDSADFSHTLHTIYGDKYLTSRAMNRVNDTIKFNADAYPKEIIFERDHYIAEIFELLKKGQIKFPLKDYDSISWLIDHCASMEMKPSIARGGGDPTIHYVKGSIPNDGLMSILNAYLAYKFKVTSGFKIKNPALMGQKQIKKDQPLIVFGDFSKNRGRF
jgi:Phage terminase large subunit (GpA)